jgi:hypothetical protein
LKLPKLQFLLRPLQLRQHRAQNGIAVVIRGDGSRRCFRVVGGGAGKAAKKYNEDNEYSAH